MVVYRFSHVILAFLLLIWTAPSLLAFCRTHHNTLIDYAFDGAKGMGTFADRGAAKSESKDVDDPVGPESGEEHQFKHSMRPSGTSLADAQQLADLYIDYYMQLAVVAAKRKPPQKTVAGRYLGRILHAVQDRKHRWTSCGPDSNLDNPPKSDSACSYTESGCPNLGEGNHGLVADCKWPKDLLQTIRNAPFSGGDLCMLLFSGSSNFQQQTDADTEKVRLEFERAEEEGLELLTKFLTRVK